MVLYIFLAIVIAFVIANKIGLLDRLMESGAAAPAKLPYRRKDYLLTRAERSFFDVLYPIAQRQNFHLFTKVRLEDLLWLPRMNYRDRFLHRNRIKSRHVDFLLCDKESIGPRLVIELDDSSHDREERRDRDGFMNNALQSAGLPIFHVRAGMGYNADQLADEIQRQLSRPVASNS